MTDHDHSLEIMVAERQALRDRVLELERLGVVKAWGVDALQTSSGRPSDDFAGCIE